MIQEFSGPNYFLSNFYAEEDGLTTEHYFHAKKATSEEEAVWVMAAPTPAEAKRRGRKVKMRPDWDQVRDAVMFRLLLKKFSDPALRKMLLDTGDQRLEEGNTWNDLYWGVDLRTGKGENRLGQLLMLVRSLILLKESDV